MGYLPNFLIWMIYIVVFIFGLIIGSFLNVVIYRVPRNQSIINPPSHCPKCNTKLKWYDMIPLLSYIILKGKCRYCGTKISFQYPLVEFLAGITFVIVFQKFGWSLQFLKWIVFTSLLISTGLIDLSEGIVPDIIVLPGLILGVLFSIFSGKTGMLESIYGLTTMGAFFLIVILLSRGGMGWGDLTFGAMIGSFLGFQLSLLTLLLAFVSGALTGLAAIIIKKKGRKDTIPFGPFLSIAAFVASIYGFEILKIYLKFLHFS